MTYRDESKWIPVSEQSSCAYCGKTDWCSVAADGGAAICRRTNTGVAETRQDKSGQDYFLYRLKARDITMQQAPKRPLYSLGDVTLRHGAYSALLDNLELSPAHYESLLRRGLSDADIHKNGYRTLPKNNREKIAAKALKAIGRNLLGVPGFHAKNKSEISIAGRPGLLVPVRNQTGQIVAMKVRADTDEKGRRYTYLSSKSHQGPGAPALVHFPLHTGPVDTILITEGELKADVTTALFGQLCISIPGVGTWRQALQAIEFLKPKRVIICFDMDHTTNSYVARALGLLSAHLLKQPMQVQIALWDPKFKGIDDALVNAAPIQFLDEPELKAHVDGIVKRFDLFPVDWSNPSRSLPDVVLEDSIEGESDDCWPDPLPLPDPLTKAPRLPIELIPNGFRAWLADVAERMQVPPEYVAIPMTVAGSIAIGRQVAIRPRKLDNWTVFVNLWGVLIGRPSTLKSPAQNEALRPLKTIASEALKEYKDGLAEWRAIETVILGQKKAIEEKIKEIAKKNSASGEIQTLQERLIELEERLERERPRPRRFYTSDGTTEKIGEILQDNPNGLLIERDEVYGFLRSLDKIGREGDRAFFLTSWNGYGCYTIDRVGRGTVVIPAVCLSVLGGIQPGRLEEYVREAVAQGSGDDGLMQRFQLMVWPEISKEWTNVDRLPDEEARARVERIFRRLVALNTDDLGAQKGEHDDAPWLRFAPDAQELFNSWLSELEHRLRNDDGKSAALESHLGKYRKLMPALALIFHVIETCEAPQQTGGVSLEAAQLAAAWCEYLEAHARKVYCLGGPLHMVAAHALLTKIQQKKIKDGQTIRELYRRHWSHLDTEDAVLEALSILQEFGWVRLSVIKDTGGAPSAVIHLHPSVRS